MALAVRLDPYVAFNFWVEIDGIIVGGFTEVSGLQVETEVYPYREGGLNDYEHHLPGPTRYPSNLILRHGLTSVDILWTWHQDVTHGVVERKNGTIYLLDRQRIPVMWWDFTGAYPIKWSGPEFNASSNTVAVETIELVHTGISKSTLSGIVSATQGLAGAIGGR